MIFMIKTFRISTFSQHLDNLCWLIDMLIFWNMSKITDFKKYYWSTLSIQSVEFWEVNRHIFIDWCVCEHVLTNQTCADQLLPRSSIFVYWCYAWFYEGFFWDKIWNKINFHLFSVNKISVKGKGCEFYCDKIENLILCPTCKEFAWHKSCAEKIFRDFSMEIPDWNSGKWKCPNCWENFIRCNLISFDEFLPAILYTMTRFISRLFWLCDLDNTNVSLTKCWPPLQNIHSS